MKQKLVLLIALVLALAQGAVAGDIVDLTAENFTAYVGQQETRTITLSFKVGSPIDPDPDPPVVDRSTREDYTICITGDRPDVFSASITSISYVSIINGTMEATVEVTYSPTDVGTHRDTLKLLNNSGRTLAYKKLLGNASYLKGDADGDGLVSVADASVLIDYILNGDDNDIIMECADVDGDGNITVADVGDLIDTILGVPDIRLCTFIVVSKTDGTSMSLMIDQNTKVEIVDRQLRLTGAMRNGQLFPTRVYTFSLEELSQIRYEERMVESNDPLGLDIEFEEISETPNTLQL